VSHSGMGLSKEVVDFDKRFFQDQLRQMKKVFEKEMKEEQVRARNQATIYLERNMEKAKAKF